MFWGLIEQISIEFFISNIQIQRVISYDYCRGILCHFKGLVQPAAPIPDISPLPGRNSEISMWKYYPLTEKCVLNADPRISLVYPMKV